MRSAVVTGATGFVGRNLIRKLLSKSIKVYALARNPDSSIWGEHENLHLIRCDLAQMGMLEKALAGVSVDVFYHLAWQGAKGPGRADYVLQTQNAQYACDAAVVASKLHSKKFVAVGTITERLADEILKEKSLAQNLMYGLTKSYTHKLLNIICAKEQMNFVWAELSNIYGGDDDSGNLISYAIDCFQRGVTPSFGTCINPYDFIHIDDVVGALYKLGEEKSEGFYFVGRCEGRTLRDYIEEVGRIYGKAVGIGIRPDDGLRYQESWFDNSRLVNEMNYEFRYTFEQGIRADMKGEA